jgi:hypothetical protein
MICSDRPMQPTSAPPAVPPTSRIDRSAYTALSQLVAKVLNAPAPQPAPIDLQATKTAAEPEIRADGRNVRLGAVVDIRV